MDYLTVREVADHLRVSNQTVYRWIESGQIEAVRVGPKVYRIRQDALDELIEKSRVED